MWLFCLCYRTIIRDCEAQQKKKRKYRSQIRDKKKDANPKSPNGPKSLRAADGKMRNAILSLEAVRHRRAHSGGVGHAGRWLRRPGRSGQRKAHTARDRQPLPVSCNIFRHWREVLIFRFVVFDFDFTGIFICIFNTLDAASVHCVGRIYEISFETDQ